MSNIITPFGLPVASTYGSHAEIKWFRNFLERHSLAPIPGSAFARALDSAEQTAERERESGTRKIDPNTASELNQFAGVDFLIKLVFRTAKNSPPQWLLDDLKLFRKAQVPFDEPYKVYPKSNYVWEFICASIISLFAANVERTEPDVTAIFRGRKVGIACKMLKTDNPDKQIRRIVTGVDQIEKADIDDGFVLVNISRLLDHKKYFDVNISDKVTFNDFGSPSTPERMISKDMTAIVRQLADDGLARPLRQKGYPIGCGRLKLRLVNFFAQTVVCVQGIPTTLNWAICYRHQPVTEFDEIFFESFMKAGRSLGEPITESNLIVV